MNMPNSIPHQARPVQHTPITVRQPVLKVIGLGGGGSNTINRMIELGLTGIEFIAANTDAQALKNSQASVKIQLGPKLTRGLGAGGDPRIGEAAAEESYKDLYEALSGADMIFLTAGMGGGTGTGSIPVAARVARALGTVTVGIVSTPFSFEVGRRQTNARDGLARLRPFTDTCITVPNDRLLQIAPRDLTLDLAFRLADDVLRQGIQGITELVTQAGMINVDFAHVRQMMQMGGGSLLSIGYAEGPSKALKAVEKALHHPLLDSIPIADATGIIANFTGGSDLTFQEIAEALTHLQARTNNQADIIPGVMTDERLRDRIQVILVITGLGATAVDAGSVAQKKPVQVAQPEPTAVQQHAPVQAAPVLQDPIPVPSPLIAPKSVPEPAPAISSSTPVRIRPQVEMAPAGTTDLDIPAFMRRRTR
jgi:cell division protein FtsZ